MKTGQMSRHAQQGMNSLYLNLAGREGQGSVQPDHQEPLLRKLRQKLLHWQGPDGRPVVQQMWRWEQVFSGPLAEYGPDKVIGYPRGYRASSDTGLGNWKSNRLEPNHDHRGADHCIDSQAVPGALFSNQSLSGYHSPSFRDIPSLIIGQQPDKGASAPPPSLSDEDREIIEERLQALGYL
jgi:predicted AlkP superfamily phosphohydrolase/phosphomutase